MGRVQNRSTPLLMNAKELVSLEVASLDPDLADRLDSLQLGFEKEMLYNVLQGKLIWPEDRYIMEDATLNTAPFEGGVTKKCFEV